jgi:hypothetical protein
MLLQQVWIPEDTAEPPLIFYVLEGPEAWTHAPGTKMDEITWVLVLDHKLTFWWGKLRNQHSKCKKK